MRRIVAVVSATVVVGGAALGLVGCGSSDSGNATTDQTEANAAFCSSLAGLGTSLTDLRKSLSPSTATKADLQSAGAAVETAWDEVEASAQNVAGVDTTALETAWDGLESTITSLPGSGQSLQQGVASVKAALGPVQTAVKGLAPGCSGTTTTVAPVTTG
jgi:hypothetical protein